MDEPGIFAVARLAELAEQLATENVGKADHRVQRRAQLMAHIGEELGLGAACLFGRVAGALKFGLVRPALGDIAGRGNQAEAVPNRDRPAAQLDRDVFHGVARARASDPEGDGDRLAAGSCARQGGEVEGPISDMHALEQAVA